MNPLKESSKSKLIKYIGIPIVGVSLAVLLSTTGAALTLDFVLHAFFSTLITAIYWMSCNGVVVFLWNKYPWHLEPIKHLVWEFVGINLVIVLVTFLNFVFFSFQNGTGQVPENLGLQLALIVILSYFLTAMHEAIFFYQQWQEHFKKSLVLEESNLKAEFENLKNQVNPHFLFNSLNTLLSISDGNSKAEKYIVHLADVLRYGLSPKHKELATLSDELDLVQKYFYLQQVRFNKGLTLSVDTEEFPLEEAFLPPLTLQMLVDNCLKHNIISSEKPLHVRIYQSQTGYLAVANNLQKRTSSDSTGQGLRNIMERYRFLSKYEVLIRETETDFIVEVPILKG